jgi:formate hydrogenlyase transcriptional activator
MSEIPTKLKQPSLVSQPDKYSEFSKTADQLGYFIFQNLPIGIYKSTPKLEGNFLLVNPALAKILGYESTEELLTISVMDIYCNPNDRKLLVQELLSNKQINQKVVKLKKKDGQCLWGAITAKVSTDETGQAIFFNGAIEDITNHKENELRLVEERIFSDTIIEALPGLFWLNDENGQIIRWNKNVESVYGYSPDELRRLHALEDVTAPESIPALIKATENAFKGGSGYCEYDIKTKSGENIAFAGNSKLVIINGKKYLVAVELDITKRKETEIKLREALDELKRIKEKTDAENIYLMDEINSESGSDYIVGSSSKLNQMLLIAKKVAPTPTTVLIQGETGTGKGLLAKYIHSKSPRYKRPLIKVNCANLPATLIESILFGHTKGAFTGASDSKIGRFELAHESTIFLDEIAELPLELQSKLLRVIEDGEFERLGGSKTILVDVRIIAATNRNLEDEVQAGNFRQDLLFRLNVYPITPPPLKDRKADIPLLVQFFIDKFNKSLGKSIKKVPNSAIERFKEYPWSGNIRELQNVIERAMINSSGSTLMLNDFSVIPKKTEKSEIVFDNTLQNIEYNHIIKILKQTGWRIAGKSGAATVLGLNPSTLRGRMRKLGISRPGKVIQF